MPLRETTSVLVRMPAGLKSCLSAEVARSGRALNDVMGGILAARFDAPFEPSGRRGSRPGDSGVVLLRIPPALKRTIQVAAHAHGSTTNRVIVETLADHFGVALEISPASTPGKLGGGRRRTMASTNGSGNAVARSQDKVRVAIIGVGNCANSLVQGLEYYRDADDDQFVPGLMHVNLGGYHIRDVEITAAFDVVKGKVGADLSDAIWAHPNDTIRFAKVPKLGVKVHRGMTHDGIGKYLSEVVV